MRISPHWQPNATFLCCEWDCRCLSPDVLGTATLSFAAAVSLRYRNSKGWRTVQNVEPNAFSCNLRITRAPADFPSWMDVDNRCFSRASEAGRAARIQWRQSNWATAAQEPALSRGRRYARVRLLRTASIMSRRSERTATYFGP